MTLKEIRESRNLTQRELAAAVGVSHGCVSMWENGQRNLNTKNMHKLAEFFNIPFLSFVCLMYANR